MSFLDDIITANLAAVESHFHAEDTNSVDAALAAFTDDCVWEAPNPCGLNKRLEGKAALRPFYQKLFSTMKNVEFRICYERFERPPVCSTTPSAPSRSPRLASGNTL